MHVSGPVFSVMFNLYKMLTKAPIQARQMMRMMMMLRMMGCIFVVFAQGPGSSPLPDC